MSYKLLLSILTAGGIITYIYRKELISLFSSSQKLGSFDEISIGLDKIEIPHLTFFEIVKWFTSHSNLYNAEETNLAFTLQKKVNQQEYNTVQGIYNKQTNQLLDGRLIKSQSYDEELAERHNKHSLVVWE